MQRKRIKLFGSNQRKGKSQLNYTIEETVRSHRARVFGVEELPNGEFKEVELGSNKVLIGGLRELSFLLYNKRPDFTKPTFEEDLYKGASVDLRPNIAVKTDTRDVPWVQGFNVSYDGSQGDGVVETSRCSDGWDFEYLIPFRVVPLELNDFPRYKQIYLHHRQVTIKGREYIEYYTKKFSLNVKAVFKDGTKVPDNPNINANTDLDCRMIAEFPVAITEEELVEHWRLRKEEGAQGAHYNSTMLMIGQPADITIGDVKYDTMLNTHTYAKSNHISVAHGVDAFITVKYQLLHI